MSAQQALPQGRRTNPQSFSHPHITLAVMPAHAGIQSLSSKEVAL